MHHSRAQARHIRSRQQQLYAAQHEWKRDMELISRLRDAGGMRGAHQVMRQARRMIEDESRRLNEEIEQVRNTARPERDHSHHPLPPRRLV